MDQSTWKTPAVPGYAPAMVNLQAKAIQGPDNGLFFTVSAIMQAPPGESYFVVAVGISLDGNGIAFAVLPTPVIVAGAIPSRVRMIGQVNPVIS